MPIDEQEAYVPQAAAVSGPRSLADFVSLPSGAEEASLLDESHRRGPVVLLIGTIGTRAPSSCCKQPLLPSKLDPSFSIDRLNAIFSKRR